MGRPPHHGGVPDDVQTADRTADEEMRAYLTALIAEKRTASTTA
jgi:hypothetical protein